MKRYAMALVTAVVVAAIGGEPAIAQSAREKAHAHLAAAKKAAGYEVSDLYDHLCARLMVGAQLPYGRIQRPDNERDPAKFHEQPVKVFDNLYYLGEKMQHGATPSSWAVVTSEGIILIDAMFEDSVRPQIVEGLKKLNLDPAAIKYLILTHGHGDHINGAKYLQDTFKPRVIMGAADWDMVEKDKNFRGPRPARDIAAVEGQRVTLGGQTVTIHVTPGHSPGTISLLIPVTDQGKPHLAALWGGTGIRDAEAYYREAQRFRDIVSKAGADIMLSTHPQLDKSDVKLRLVEKRKAGDPHPYVVGNEVVKSYMTVATECSAVALLLPEEFKAYLGR